MLDANKIKLIRVAAGKLTQDELAKELGVGRTMVSKCENNRENPEKIGDLLRSFVKRKGLPIDMGRNNDDKDECLQSKLDKKQIMDWIAKGESAIYMMTDVVNNLKARA